MMQRLAVRLGRLSLSSRFSTNKPAQSTAATTSAQEMEDDGMNLQLYYRNLLRNTRVRLTNGMGRFNISHMNSMIKLARTDEDAKLLLEAYYNLLGNFTKLNNTVTDRMVVKYLNAGGDPAKMLELFEHHTFLMYFPHYNATTRLLEAVQDDPEKLQQLLKLLKSRVFIKIDASFVGKALEAAKDNAEATTAILQLAALRTNLLKLNPEYVLKAVSNGLLEYNEQTQELFESAHKLLQQKPPTEVNQVVAYARFLLEMGAVSDSMIRVSKLTELPDEITSPYWSSLLVRFTKLKEENQLDQLSKLQDQYTVLLSSKKLEGETNAFHQQILSLGEKPNSTEGKP